MFALFGLLLAVGLWSCRSSVVTPPEARSDPVSVHLLSAGRHAGLVLPCGDGRTVEYGYGSWNWYALARDDWWRLPAVVLWPTPGCLGRRYESDDDRAAMESSDGRGTIVELRVERESAHRLLAQLDAQFAAGGEPIFNSSYDMFFVKHPDDFWMLHDCHDEVAEWLADLGCSVTWSPIRTGLRIADDP